MCRAVTSDGAVTVSTDLRRSVRACDAAWVTAGGGGAGVPRRETRDFGIHGLGLGLRSRS
jgi:hypothetical protein